MVNINASLVINAGTAATIGKIIVLHSTDDLEATAANLAAYEHRVWKSAQTFVHYGVDDQGAYQVGIPGRVAWGAGNVNRYAPVQIELCEFADHDRAMAAYRNWIEVAVTMADKFGVPRTLDDGNRTAGFKSHQWCSATYGGSDHGDPYPWLTKLGISKAQLAADLKAGKASAAVAPSQTAPSGIAVDGDWGVATTQALQRVYGTPVDGVLSGQVKSAANANLFSAQWGRGGSLLIAKIQRALGVTADGYCGPDTIRAMQRKLGTPVDGVISRRSLMVSAMQRKLNAGERPF